MLYRIGPKGHPHLPRKTQQPTSSWLLVKPPVSHLSDIVLINNGLVDGLPRTAIETIGVATRKTRRPGAGAGG